MKLDITHQKEVLNVSNVNQGLTHPLTPVPVLTAQLVTNVTQQLKQPVIKGSTPPAKVLVVSPASPEP